MKKELEDVYVKVEELKTIERDREKLIEEVQETERLKLSCSKQYENSKFEIMKLEAENKKYILELKHYKNIVNRIQASDYSFD